MLKRKNYITSDCSEDQKYKELLRACPFIDNQELDTGMLFIKVSYKLMMIKIKDRDLIEGFDDYVKLHLHPRPVLVLMTMKALADILPSNEFVRINRSYIIPVSKILSINKRKVRVAEKEVSIGTRYTNAYKQLLGTPGLKVGN